MALTKFAFAVGQANTEERKWEEKRQKIELQEKDQQTDFGNDTN